MTHHRRRHDIHCHGIRHKDIPTTDHQTNAVLDSIAVGDAHFPILSAKRIRLLEP